VVSEAMFFSRRINRETGRVEVWECQWSNRGTGMAKKEFVRRLGEESETEFSHDDYSAEEAICWAPGTTIGNIAVKSDAVFGMFDGNSGSDAILPCQIIPAGKFRNGKPRWYCKTHQHHWGVKADYAAAANEEEVRCGNHLARMSYVVDPLEIDFQEFEEIGIWCSLPPALSSEKILKRAPQIHVHKRFRNQTKKFIDADYPAIVCAYNQHLGLFENTEITKIQVTPPAAFEFVRALEESRALSCVTCSKCGYPHLDLGSFAETPHRKHFCGNCGNDSIWSSEAIVSTPLKPLHDQFSNSNDYVVPDRVLDLDSYAGKTFELWSSTPAVLWTANRPQEKGIHVHVYEGCKRIVDDTYGVVFLEGCKLDRRAMWERMISNTIR
jgi:hypothetical protein